MLERIATGKQVKVVAGELGISESRVNQHIRRLKEQLSVDDRIGLYEAWLRIDPCRNLQSTRIQLSERAESQQLDGGPGLEPLRLSDAIPLTRPAPWEGIELRVGPGALEGPGAGVKRGAAIAVIAVCLVVLMLLIVAGYVLVMEVIHTR